jgi:hypothetical protein
MQKPSQKLSYWSRYIVFGALLNLLVGQSLAFKQPERGWLPNFDKRSEIALTNEVVSADQKASVERLRWSLPRAQVDFDPITGAPRSISARERFLSGQNGVGNAVSASAKALVAVDDPYAPAKMFLSEYRGLFGFGPEILDAASIKREIVGANNGLRTVVWEQQVDGVPVFESVLIAHITVKGELVNICSQFVPDPIGAATRGVGDRASILANPKITAAKAVSIAAGTVGEQAPAESLVAGQLESGAPSTPAEQRQKLDGPGLLGAEAKLVWLPMSRDVLVLCWEVIFTSRSRSEMFRVLVDARSGVAVLRQGLTEYISNVSYRVFTNDSPSPFSPGYPSPVTNQPPVVARALVTLPALDTNASPSGWIDDGGNETRGNNVDAHTDRDANNIPDVPRPQGSPARVFDILLNLTKDPTNYSSFSVVQLFYLCNYYHDRLYELGFTESAGNFQSNNFGRGGFGGDAVQADGQDGSGFNNANFSTPPDGSAGRMQMYLWSGPNPRRDGDLDAEIVFHEHTHGVSNRRVGGGVGISALQPRGMGEGWSDFFALSLLSQPGDDVNGVYAAAAYSTYQEGPNYLQNYYFGIRRYPYTTDMSKNPLTYNDIDTQRADNCAASAPFNAAFFGSCANTDPSEVHNQGEVWCVTLWDVRANLVNKYGWAIGNQLALQLVFDGMNLSPANPTFLQSRDAIIQADVVDNAGANRTELWAGFAKRGMGYSADGPINSTTVGAHESFDTPDELKIAPTFGLASSGAPGGPFSPQCQAYFLSNPGSNSLTWSAFTNQPWVTVTPASGTLSPGAASPVVICIGDAANALSISNYSATVSFSNNASGFVQTRDVSLAVTPPRVLFVPLDTDPGWTRQGQWAFGKPAGLGGASHGQPDPTGGATGTNVFGVNLNGDYSTSLGLANRLVAGPFNFGGYANTKLAFQRWLNTDHPPFVYAMVEISTNGSTWSPVWTNGLTEITDSSWNRVVYDISGTADNQPSVYVRWSYQVAQSVAYPYSGWNIDDIEFLGVSTLDHFSWGHLPGPQSAGVPFVATIQAQDATNGIVGGFSGTVSLSATNSGVSISPVVSGNFIQGVWTGSMLTTQLVSNLVLKADDGAGHTALANPIDVVSAPTLNFGFDGTTLSIAWPAGAPALILESSDSVSPATWTTVPGSPVLTGDQYVMQVDTTAPQRYFRLRYTSP